MQGPGDPIQVWYAAHNPGRLCEACGLEATLGYELRLYTRFIWLCDRCAPYIAQEISSHVRPKTPETKGEYHAHRD
ncbi:MAG: hypothetical protein ACYCOU_20255 [Sulfobacillus sp.]